jgi:hypothetical protein
MSKADFSPKDQLIVAQVAVKGAIDMIVAGKTDKALAEAAAYIDSVVWRIAAETGAVAPALQAVPDYEPDFADLVHQEFPGAQNVAAPAPAAPAAAPTAVSPMPPHSADTRDKAEKAANKAWGTARYQAAPDEFWDNRPKKAAGEYKPNSPDLKHKESGLAVWL